MRSCSCYHERKELRYLSEFEQGVEFARTGKRKTASEKIVSECWGTKEREPCSCKGFQDFCDFYPKYRLRWFSPYREILDYHGIEYALYDYASSDLIESSSECFKPRINRKLYLGADHVLVRRVVTDSKKHEDLTLIPVRPRGVVLALPTSTLSSNIDDPLFILMNSMM